MIPEKNITPQIISPILAEQSWLKHGFFTRCGGVSSGLFSTLNTAYDKGDPSANVDENRRRICALLETTPHTLVTARQVHSADVWVIDRPLIYDIATTQLPAADALVTSEPGLALGIMTADCVPILLADPTKKIIAAVHAGWKGATAGIIQNTLQEMRRLGAQIERTIAAIGPCIWQSSYEVSEDFYTSFPQQRENSPFFIPGQRDEHWQFDLPGYVMNILKKSGVMVISPSPYDTYAHPELFFSYRRKTIQGEGQFGCGLSVIKITPENKPCIN